MHTIDMETSPNLTPSPAAAAAAVSTAEAEAAAAENEIEEEEFWPTIGIGQSIQVRREVQEISLTRNSHLRLWMLQEKDLTPLDMTYDDWKNEDENPSDGDDNDYYDGTGGMLWMAATCWCIMVSLQVPSLMQYLRRRRPSSVSSTFSKSLSEEHECDQDFLHHPHRVCELGCGTGAAGIALLKFCSGSPGRRGQRRGTNLNNAKSDTDDETPITNDHHDHHDDYHVVFTDSDKESLDWCQMNCELNDIDPSSYCQNVLSWGLPGIQRLQQQQQQYPGKNEPTALNNNDANNDSINKNKNTNDEHKDEEEKENVIIPHSFDTIIATDVIYDLTMILPLFQTAELLLVHNNNTSKQKQCRGRTHLRKNEDRRDDKKKEDHHDNLDDDDVAVDCKYNDPGGNYVILTHVPRFCLPQDTENSGNNRNDSDNDNVHIKETTNYLELEQHITKIATEVGFALKDMLRVDESLKGYYQSDSGSFTWTTEEPSLSLEKIHDSHAVILVFERSLS